MKLHSADCRLQIGVRAGALACAAVLATAGPALAQRANGPFAGLFGAQPSGERVQGLDLNGSVFGIYQRNLFPQDEAFLLDSRLRESGLSGGVSGLLSYDRRADRVRFRASGGGSGVQYATEPSLRVGSYQAAAALQADLSSKVGLEITSAAGYSPFYQFAPFSEGGLGVTAPAAPGFGYAAAAGRNLRLDGSVELTGNLSRRSSIYARATGSETRLLDDAANNLRMYGAHAGYQHKLTRSLGFHVGYGTDVADVYRRQAQDNYRNDSIDVGVDYGDQLSFARRTSLSFSSSTSATRYRGDTHYRLNGSVSLSRGFRRTWSSWIGYNRNNEFRIGFLEPLLTDSISSGVRGQLARRVAWSGGIGYTHGTVGFRSNETFGAYSGSSRLDVGLTRVLGLFGQYTYYHYNLPVDSSVFNVVPDFTRHAVSVGLSLWVPLINDVRPPKDPRQP